MSVCRIDRQHSDAGLFRSATLAAPDQCPYTDAAGVPRCQIDNQSCEHAALDAAEVEHVASDS